MPGLADILNFHYLTQDLSGVSHRRQVEEACTAGLCWVQFRTKVLRGRQLEEEVTVCRSRCADSGVTFILNDHVHLASAVEADGVHLGKEDMPLGEARKILGAEAIIGATANTVEDIRRAAGEGANYVGLGPYRFTSTKKRLAPVLGLAGYEKVMEQVQELGIPVIAIGGIDIGDIEGLIQAGVHGLAISSAINLSVDRMYRMKQFKMEIEHAALTHCKQGI